MTTPPADFQNSDLPGGGIASNSHEVQYWLLDESFDLMKRTTLMTLGLVPLFFLLFYNYFPIEFLLLFVGMMAIRMVVSFATQRAWRHRAVKVPADLLPWQRLFWVSNFVAALAWSASPTLMFFQANGYEQALLTGIVITVCAVSMNTQAGQPWAMLTFLVTVLVPPAVALVVRVGWLEHLLAAELVGALVVLSLVGRRAFINRQALVKGKIDLRDALAAASSARAQAEASSKAKSRFLANMSHELRTPLNAVIGAAQLLKSDRSDSQAQPQLIDAIHQSGNNLLGLIENILDLSRIEAGELTLINSDFDLLDCITEAAATGDLAARSKGLKLSCEVQDDLDLWRHADPTRIKQILNNLLGNAVKFTTRGSVRLKAERGEHADDVRFRIEDTGVGISKPALPFIFDAFRQAEEKANRRFGGSGLGLSIVHQLVTAMGGQVKATSEESVGTTIEFVLRLPPGESLSQPGYLSSKPPSADASPVKPGPPPMVRVLVVEDDALNLAIVCRLLTQGNFEPVTATSGAEAIRILSEDFVDVVLMDWQMPEMDGLECTQLMRAGASGTYGQTVPIVALTANAFAEDRAACLAAGMNDFLTKPVQGELLRARVAHWAKIAPTKLGGKPQSHSAKTTTTQSVAKAIALPVVSPVAEPVAMAYDPSVLAATLGIAQGSGDALELELITLFSQEKTTTLMAIEQAIANQNRAGLKIQMHTLKSTSAAVGAMEIAQLAASQDLRLRSGQNAIDDLLPRLRACYARFEEALADYRLTSSEAADSEI